MYLMGLFTLCGAYGSGSLLRHLHNIATVWCGFLRVCEWVPTGVCVFPRAVTAARLSSVPAGLRAQAGRAIRAVGRDGYKATFAVAGVKKPAAAGFSGLVLSNQAVVSASPSSPPFCW